MDAEAATRNDAGGYVIGRLADFPEGSHRIVEVGGRQIGIFNIRNELYALPNICPHQTGPVCAGRSLTGSVLASGQRLEAGVGSRRRSDRLSVARTRISCAHGPVSCLPPDPPAPVPRSSYAKAVSWCVCRGAPRITPADERHIAHHRPAGTSAAGRRSPLGRRAWRSQPG